MARLDDHPLISAIRPLLDRIGAEVVPPSGISASDVPLDWQGETIGAVRLPGAEPGSALHRLVHEVELELGTDLGALDRPGKQQAVRLLEERGAFTLRKSVETVAEALGVTRFTVYNYLNRES